MINVFPRSNYLDYLVMLKRSKVLNGSSIWSGRIHPTVCILVSVSSCHIGNYHKLCSLKKNKPKTFVISQFCRWEVWARLRQLFCPGFHKAEMKVLAGLHSQPEAWAGKNLFPSSFRLLAEFDCINFHGYSTEGHVLLLAAGQGLLSDPEICLEVLVTWQSPQHGSLPL